MKRVHVIVVILVTLTLMILSFSSLVSAQTVWRDGEQFKVVNSNQVVLFNISNVPISVPKDAKDINVTIHARFRLLRAPDIVNVSAFVCEVNSDNVVFTLSSSGSKRAILKAHMKPNKLSNWNVTFCPGDICSNVLNINITLVNVSPIDGAVKISNAYVVLSNRSSSLEVLIPTRDFVGVTVVYRRENITFRSEVENVSSQNLPQNNNSTPWAGIIGVGILLVILIPTVAFLFSNNKQEYYQSSGGSFIGVLVSMFIFSVLQYAFGISWSLILNSYIMIISLVFWNEVDNLWKRGMFFSFIISSLIINNIALLLWIGVNYGDFFIFLLVLFMVFGVGVTFALVWNWERALLGVFIYILILIISLLLSLKYPLYGFTLITLMGYAVVFIQVQIKNNIEKSTLKRHIRIRKYLHTLDAFYNLVIGAFIAPGSIILAYAFTTGLGFLENSNNTSVQYFQYVFLLYLGLTLISVFLMWTDDKRRSSPNRRLTLRNTIVMLLIVLGIGSASILELNNHKGLACIIFLLEAVPGALLLALLNRRN
ncbi:hypothetical protein [Thermococcus sp.]|uniref:hypothetical protein n=1 Tax=Thermococcus sp. TaxID=35749 RepID=UPI002611A6B2|nr:hypothetical protein [Thermococcus sp.]